MSAPGPLPQAPPAAPAAGAAEPVSLAQRLSDRLNPILVRETLQAMNGRTFAIALGLSLAAILLVALETGSGSSVGRAQGWQAFVVGMSVLAPLLTFVVPMQAFLSMRQEVTGGCVEHLLLSRLTPARVIRGKVAAAGVEAVLFLSVFAPLLALTFLLRGVDVPTIASALLLVTLYGLGATTFAVAMGAVSRWPGMRALPMVAVALGLTLGAGSLTAGMGDVLGVLALGLRVDTGGWNVLLVLAVPVAVVAPLFFLVASSALAHPYENRSTAFRAYAVAALVGFLAWIAWQVERIGAGHGASGEATPSVATVAAAALFPFWLFAATEEPRLSPRVRTLVPRNRVLAALATPFLPGGSRGFLFVFVLGIVAVAASGFLPRIFGGVAPHNDRLNEAATAWCYVVVYASAARGLRAALPPGPRWTTILRAAFPLLVLLVAMVPALLHTVSGGPPLVGSHYPLAALNPLVGVDHEAPASVVIAAAVAVLAQVLPMARGAAEVARASRERRLRAR